VETKAGRLTADFTGAGHEVTVLGRGGSVGGTPAVSRTPVVRVPFHQVPRRLHHVSRQLRFARQLPGVTTALGRAARDARSDVVLTLAITSYAPYAVALARVTPVVLSLEG